MSDRYGELVQSGLGRTVAKIWVCPHPLNLTALKWVSLWCVAKWHLGRQATVM